MNRLPFDLGKMRYIIGIECVYLILFALSGGDAWNWFPAAYSNIPLSLTLTSFLHFGFIHLLSNMYALFIFGWVLTNCVSERKVKGLTLPLLFIAASVVTGIAPFYLQPDAYTAGASGTVYALEAYVFVMAFAGGSDPLSLRLRQQKTWLIGNAIISVIWSFRPGVSLYGHFSGAAVGAAAAFIDLQRRKRIKRLNDMKKQFGGS